ncbi:MAG: hypothetical protein WKF81_13415, partial [Thermomicrobiales bacterium]
TLDSSSLPDGYSFAGETFLSADQLAAGDVTADELATAGFVGYYISEYGNATDGTTIRSYVSAWTSAAEVQAGFDLLEDEARVSPEGTFTDGITDVGSDPRELTTGTYADAADEATTIGSADVTFAVDRFLVGVAIETGDGSEANVETATTLAADLQTRAEGVVGGTAPAATDLALPVSVIDISAFGMTLQSGYLNATEAEQQLGLTGSALSGFSTSWVQSVGLGADGAMTPIVTVASTVFADEAATTTVIEQAAELTPGLDGLTVVDGVSIEGASGVAAYSFSSAAVEGSDVDSFRIIFASGTTLTVIDVQGAPSPEAAQEAATELANADPATAPAVPASLAA